MSSTLSHRNRLELLGLTRWLFVLPSICDHPDCRPSIGVTSHEISLEKQEVLVKATIPYDDVLAKIKKTGKEVKSGEVVA